MNKKLSLAISALTLILALVSCGQPAASPTPTAVPPAMANKEYLEILEIVWGTVNETYFDPTFGGLDWNEIHDYYQPLIAAAESDKQFYLLINEMLWELDVSHAFVAPPGYLSRILPTSFAEGSVGIDVRLLDGEAVVVSVAPGSPGEGAGLRPGYVIQSIDSQLEAAIKYIETAASE
jgi:carboxyl-terminal processing protease